MKKVNHLSRTAANPHLEKKDFRLGFSHAGVRMATRHNQNKLQDLRALGGIMLTRVTFL